MSTLPPPPHDSAHLHVSGRAQYADDIPLPANALHGAFGMSSIAHGRVIKLDLAPVKAAPGVVAVFAAEDVPEQRSDHRVRRNRNYSRRERPPLRTRPRLRARPSPARGRA